MCSKNRAADALLLHDPYFQESLMRLDGVTDKAKRKKIALEIITEIKGTWTLTLAAHAGKQTEKDVLLALACRPQLLVQTRDQMRHFVEALYA